MNSIEFGKMLKPLNLKYMELFNYIPCISDFSCTRDEYIEAIKQSIIYKKDIVEYLVKIVPLEVKDAET